jgi:hypothetical protein
MNVPPVLFLFVLFSPGPLSYSCVSNDDRQVGVNPSRLYAMETT